MSNVKKERLDILVTEAGLAPSREKAKALIMAGQILVNNEREDKPGSAFPADAVITMKGNPLKYVSRGGLKLEKAVAEFGLDLKGHVCMDVGASTGGFTDCMLQNGASHVYSVDVGYGQLDWKLRNDERVTVLEKTNIRYLEADSLDEKPDFVSIDVSFISLSKVLGQVKLLMAGKGEIAALIKPQFEAGREKVGKKGVVRDPAVHLEVIENVLAFTKEMNLHPVGLTFSPVKGPEGNIEYLVHLIKDDGAEDMQTIDANVPARVVEEAHKALDK